MSITFQRRLHMLPKTPAVRESEQGQWQLGAMSHRMQNLNCMMGIQITSFAEAQTSFSDSTVPKHLTKKLHFGSPDL